MVYAPRAEKTGTINKIFISFFDGKPNESIEFVNN
jgi:hypothetical protein